MRLKTRLALDPYRVEVKPPVQLVVLICGKDRRSWKTNEPARKYGPINANQWDTMTLKRIPEAYKRT